MLSTSERNVLKVFRQFMVSRGKMLCFYGPQLEKFRTPLRNLTERELLVQERFRGGYSLTRAGFAAMKECE